MPSGTAVLVGATGVAWMLLVVHIVRSARSGHGNLVLRSAPLAALPLVLAPPAGLLRTISVFTDIARTGSSGLQVVIGPIRDLIQISWFGLIAVAMTIVAAVVANLFLASHADAAVPEDHAFRSWHVPALIGAVLVFVPVLALNAFVHSIAHTILTLALGLIGQTSSMSGSEMSSASRTLGAHMIAGLIGGLVEVPLVLAAIAVGFVASSPHAPSQIARITTGLVVALAVAALVAGIVGYRADLRQVDDAIRLTAPRRTPS